MSSLAVNFLYAIFAVVSECLNRTPHRLSHQTPFLWRFHSVHHAPEHIDWLVNTRRWLAGAQMSLDCASKGKTR